MSRHWGAPHGFDSKAKPTLNHFPNSGYRLHGKLGEQQKSQCYNLRAFSKLEGSS